MPNLFCSVGKCTHNAEGCCCLEGIDVSGCVAKENTRCNNFSEIESFSSSLESPSEFTLVSCGAEDCVHNENFECMAQSIEIRTCGPDCEYRDTECDSFIRK